mgnify:CR=1 FL=1
MQLPIYFFGDNHFQVSSSKKEEKKIEKFWRFLNAIKNNNDKGTLFIMGDLFDYYFEYKNRTPQYHKEIFALLADVKNEGFDIHFVAGNHDYWIGKHFENHITKSYLDDTAFTINNKKFYITHGDGILSWDKSYRCLKSVLRSKLFIRLFSLIPEIIAFKIAEKISYERKDSHKIDRQKEDKIHKELESFANNKIQEGCDYIIMGHYHHSYHKKLNNGELILLGECDEDNYNYAVFDGNQLKVKNF